MARKILDGGGEGSLAVRSLDTKSAQEAAVHYHYLHRKQAVTKAWGLFKGTRLVGFCSFGSPASRQVQLGACPSAPNMVIEFNRLWVDDCCARNTESWFVSRALKFLEPRIVVSYADTLRGHIGYIYRALNFFYGGWTDMDQNLPRLDYIPVKETLHSRSAFDAGFSGVTRRRGMKIRYWTVTGDRRERKELGALCGWPRMNWKIEPPPGRGEHYKRGGPRAAKELGEKD